MLACSTGWYDPSPPNSFLLFLHSCAQCGLPLFLSLSPPLSPSFILREIKSLGPYQIPSTWLNKTKTICITFPGINIFLWLLNIALSRNIAPSTLGGSNKYDVFHILWRQNGAAGEAQRGKRTSDCRRGTHSACLRRYLWDKTASSVRKGAYLVILIRGDGNEIRFRENVSPEGAVREFEYVVGSHNMKARLIFVHRVKYGL